MRASPARLLLWSLAAVAAWSVPAAAQSSANVLLVINEASEASVQVGDHYAQVRGIPEQQVVRLTTATTETIPRTAYSTEIETPILEWLERNSLQDQILYIVLTKGVPIRISGTGGLDGTTASVDSELTLLYRRMLGRDEPVLGRRANPYFLGDRSLSDAKKLTRFDSELYLVTRLDGYTVEDVVAMIDRGLEPSRDGRIVLDQRSTLFDPGGDRWLFEAANRLEAMGAADRVVLETSDAVADPPGVVLGYFSWGSNDANNQLRGAGEATFTAGALAGMFVSTDGRTFQEPPEDWKPGRSNLPPGQFGSGSQSMAADFVRQGASGVSAHVSEPLLDGTIRPQILFPAYLEGFNLAEAFYLAMPFLSWQTIIIGDPLVAPFRVEPLAADAIAGGIDDATLLPSIFAGRRLAVVNRPGFNGEALQLMLRADVYLTRDDQAGAEALLAQALELEPRMTDVAMRLAEYHDERDEHAQAEERYRDVLAVDPDHIQALNNLAYSLAIYSGALDEALPLAERALRLANTPMIADTVGWIHYLRGDAQTALTFIDRAVAGLSENGEVRFHAAAVNAALGQFARARTELARALQLDPALGENDDVRALQSRLGGQ